MLNLKQQAQWLSCRWGETTSLNCGHQRACCSSPTWYISIEKHGRIISAGKISWFVHQSYLAIYRLSRRSKAGETGEGNDEFCLKMYLFHTLMGSLTHRKILWHGADGFTSPPKEGVLRNFIALKNPSPSAGFNPVNVWSNGKQENHYITEDD
jgi:hypothetical protein